MTEEKEKYIHNRGGYMKVEKLSDFNQVIKYYKEILKFAKDLRPNISASEMNGLITGFDTGSVSEISYYRVLCNNISLFISQVHEKTREMDDEQLLDASFDKIESIKNIQGKNGEISLFGKKKQLRNCLAHAEYKLVFEGFEKVKDEESRIRGVAVKSLYIELENDHIKGKIPFADILEFAQKYKDAYSYLQNNDEISFLINSDMFKIKTLDEYIEKTRKVRFIPKKDESGLPFEKFVYRLSKECKISKEGSIFFHNMLTEWRNMLAERKGEKTFKTFEYKQESMPEDRKAFMKKYISYIGFKNFMNDNTALEALNEFFAPNLKGIVSLDQLIGIAETSHDILKTKKMLQLILQGNMIGGPNIIQSIQKTVDEVKKYRFQGPMIYANNLLGLAYYCFDYSREVNENYEKEFFDFYDIENLDEIKAKLVYKDGTVREEEVVEKINPRQKAENSLAEVTTRLKKLREEKLKKENTITSLKNPKNRNPKKDMILKNIDEWMSTYPELEKKLMEEQKVADRKVENSDDEVHEDSTNFFRHLRNSMAHGNYTINYNNFNDKSAITYIFEDHDEKSNAIYCVEITAKQLEKIIDGFQQKINKCSKEYIEGERLEKKLLEEALRGQAVSQSDIDAQSKAEENTNEIDKGHKEETNDPSL